VLYQYTKAGLMRLSLQPITFTEAAAFIRRFHRHHLPRVDTHPLGQKTLWEVAV
jgi:hypothetical protein